MALRPNLITSDLLQIESDVEFVGAVIDSLWSLPWPVDQNDYVDFYRNLSHCQRMLWSTWIVQNATENGGIGAIFTRVPDQCYLDDAIVGFQEIGQIEMKALVQKACSYVDEHKQQIENITSQKEFDEILGWLPLWDMSGEFCDLVPDFYVKRRKYILSNLSEFASDA